ncbi:MAG: DUF4240 domain-containing protein [Leptospiraceae bacterium]|nr:DUF4240 domain-containing protein [Leptospiraceae bacterium]
MKVTKVLGIYEEGKIILLEPAPTNKAKVVINFFSEEQKLKLMNEEIFWSIISLLNFSGQNSNELIRPCINRLSDFEPEDIYQFEEILAEKLFAIDGKQFANSMNLYFSVDSFLYKRCGAIAKGKNFYHELLKNPFLFSEVESFEPILYIAERAYRIRTGLELEPSTLSYETYSNQTAWTE